MDDPGYGFDLGPSDGIGSQDFGELDLGLDFGDGPVTTRDEASVVDESVEVGRDAPTPRSAHESLDSAMIGRRGRVADKDIDVFSYRSREASEHPFGAEMDIDMPFGPDVAGADLDLGLDFGDGPPPEREKTPGQTRSPSRMCRLVFWVLLNVILIPHQHPHSQNLLKPLHQLTSILPPALLSQSYPKNQNQSQT